MSGVVKRTIYYDDSKGYITWLDWAEIKTAVGMAVEPFIMQRFDLGDTHKEIANFEFDDQTVKIDAIERADVHTFNRMLSGGGDNPPLHGGYGMPRDGI